jgi:hypothetical protein
MKTLKQTLMHRDDLTSDEANLAIREAISFLDDYDDPEELIYSEFGLEPDFIFDLLAYCEQREEDWK